MISFLLALLLMADLTFVEMVATGPIHFAVEGGETVSRAIAHAGRRSVGQLRAMYGIDDMLARGESSGFVYRTIRYHDGTLITAIHNNGMDSVRIVPASIAEPPSVPIPGIGPPQHELPLPPPFEEPVFPEPAAPIWPVVEEEKEDDPAEKVLVITSDFDSPVRVYFAETLQLIAEIPLPSIGGSSGSDYLSITPDNTRVFVANYDSEFGTYSVIDLVGDDTVDPPIPPFTHVASFDTGSNWPTPNYSVVSPDNKYLYASLANGGPTYNGMIVCVDIRKTIALDGEIIPNPALYTVVQSIEVDAPWHLVMSRDGSTIITTTTYAFGFGSSAAPTYNRAARYVIIRLTAAGDGPPSMSVSTHNMPPGPFDIRGFTVSAEGDHFYAHTPGAPYGIVQTGRGPSEATTGSGEYDPYRHLSVTQIYKHVGLNANGQIITQGMYSTWKQPALDFAIDIAGGSIVTAVLDETPMAEYDVGCYAETKNGKLHITTYPASGDVALIVEKRNKKTGSYDEIARVDYDNNIYSTGVVCTKHWRFVVPRAPSVAGYPPAAPDLYCAITELGFDTEMTDATKPHWPVEMPRRLKVRVMRHTSAPVYVNLGTPWSTIPITTLEVWSERRDYFLMHKNTVPSVDPPSINMIFPLTCTSGRVSLDWFGDFLTDPTGATVVFETWRSGDTINNANRFQVVTWMQLGVWYELVFANDTTDASVKEFTFQQDSGLPADPPIFS